MNSLRFTGRGNKTVAATPPAGPEKPEAPKIKASTVEYQLIHTLKDKGVKPRPERLPHYAWLNCWNIPLTLALVGVGALGCGRIQSMWRGPDLSQYSPDAVRMAEKMKNEGVSHLQGKEIDFLLKEVLTLDPATRDKLEVQFNTVLKEAAQIRSDQMGHGPTNVLKLFGLGILGIILLVAIGSRVEEDDQSLAVLKRLILLPKSFMDGMRLRRFEMQPLSESEEKKLGEVLGRAGEKALEIQTRLSEVLTSQPGLKADLEELNGQLPTAEALLQGFLYRAMDALANSIQQGKPGNRTIRLPEVVNHMVGLMEDSLETGYLLTGVVLPEEQKATQGSDNSAEEKLLRFQILSHTLAQAINQERLKPLQSSLKEVEGQLQAAGRPGAQVTDFQLMDLQAKQAEFKIREARISGYANLAANVKHTLVQKMIERHRAAAGLQADTSRSDAIGRVLSVSMPAGMSREDMALLMEVQPNRDEAVRLKVQADELLRSLSGGTAPQHQGTAS